MVKEELIRLIREAMKQWEGVRETCPFCEIFQEGKRVGCVGCPIDERFGGCYLSKNNPYNLNSVYYLEQGKSIEMRWVGRLRRENIIKCGKEWLKELGEGVEDKGSQLPGETAPTFPKPNLRRTIIGDKMDNLLLTDEELIDVKLQHYTGKLNEVRPDIVHFVREVCKAQVAKVLKAGYLSPEEVEEREEVKKAIKVSIIKL